MGVSIMPTSQMETSIWHAGSLIPNWQFSVLFAWNQPHRRNSNPMAIKSAPRAMRLGFNIDQLLVLLLAFQIHFLQTVQ